MSATDDFNALIQKVNSLQKENHVNNFKIEDTYCLNLLQPLIQGYPILPFTGSSLRPFCLLHIINDIIANSRTRIIEFGSGVSTILIARLIRKNGLDTTVISVDHNKDWSDFIDRLLRKEGLNEHVQLVYAPLSACDLAIDSNKWYDIEILRRKIPAGSFDMVIVDGPPAWEPEKATSRYPALPFIFDKLSADSSLYLDDVNRKGEQFVLGQWTEKYAIQFQTKGRTLAYADLGKSYYVDPFAYY